MTDILHQAGDMHIRECPSRNMDLGQISAFPMTRLHVVDHHLTKAGARHLRRTLEQTSKVIGDFLGED